jgi:hypothetical protein
MRTRRVKMQKKLVMHVQKTLFLYWSLLLLPPKTAATDFSLRHHEVL